MARWSRRGTPPNLWSRWGTPPTPRRGLLVVWSIAIAALLPAGGCSLIIGSELDKKPLAGSTGGGAVDAGSDGDGSRGCHDDGDCASTPGTPSCDTGSGICVECTATDDACPAGYHCALTMKCVAACTQASDCPSLANATSECVGGGCALAACLPGFGNCDGITTNGCEVDLQTAPADCGACGNDCSLSVLHASAGCTGGACSLIECDQGYKNCDNQASNGCEVDIGGDVDNCGGCGMVCALPNAATACQGGACAIAACDPGFLDCDKAASDGCEVAKYSDLDNCGGCGMVCVLPYATTTCNAGVCVVEACQAGHGDCDGDPTTGCETNLETDPGNCGACGLACSTNHATPSCSQGVCGILACQAGYQDCDGNAANGCDAQTSSDVANCGSCGHVCPSTNGTPNCVGGGCGFASCAAGLGSCSGAGCTTPLDTVENCGGCGIVCTTPNGTPGCLAGACATKSCNAGYADCDGNAANGCEAQTTSLANCGGCGQVCSLPNANATCATGACAVSSCVAPFANCDGSDANGCETNTGSDAAHCGGCGLSCSSANGTPSCSGGTCSISCSPGFGDCDGDVADGCETNLKTDPNHCGGCSTACSLPHAVAACSNGTCAVGSCVAPYADCDGVAANGCETDTSSATAACGACGNACNAQNGAATCMASTCGIVCNAGYANCDGKLSNGCETALGSDVSNCGSCSDVCPSTNGTPNCVGGACGFASCTPGFGNCSGSGCTTDLATDPANCGACGKSCGVVNGKGVCAGGACAIASCNPGFANCSGQFADGCNTSLATSASCGACGTPCSLPNAVASCVSGVCALVSCVGSFADCDHDPTNGCEVDLANEVANCGACGNACSTANASPTCVAAACVLTCNAGFGDCDQNPATGCETSTTNDPRNCGACGRACAATNAASVDCSAGICDSTCALGYANCSLPAAPAADDGCETSAGSSAASCGSCTNSCALQGPAGQPLVCGAASPAVCGCAADASCNLPGAGGTCGPNGSCVCGGAGCNPGEVCVNQGADACSCNGGAACTSPQTCCESPMGCVDLTSTPGSCGACGHACPPGFVCQSSQCGCSLDAQCSAGSPGTCAGGTCACAGTMCAPGQRCLAGGSCG